jgi:hypothetical protein
MMPPHFYVTSNIGINLPKGKSTIQKQIDLSNTFLARTTITSAIVIGTILLYSQR